MAKIYSFPQSRGVQIRRIKKTKIRWKRLFLWLGMLVLLVYGSVHLLTDISFIAKDVFLNLQEKNLERSISKYEQVEVVINYGDTAWEIQKQLTPNEDVRIPLYLAETLNPGVKMGELTPGQKIIMLKEKQ